MQDLFHSNQFEGFEIPASLRSIALYKLENEIFDAFDSFQIQEDENNVRSCWASKNISAYEDIFLIDHAIVFSNDEAASNQFIRDNLKMQPSGFIHRMCNMMAIDTEDGARTEEDLLDSLAIEIWRYAGQ